MGKLCIEAKFTCKIQLGVDRFGFQYQGIFKSMTENDATACTCILLVFGLVYGFVTLLQHLPHSIFAVKDLDTTNTTDTNTTVLW